MKTLQKIANKTIRICKYTRNTAAPISFLDYMKFRFKLYPKHIHWPISKLSKISFPEKISIGKGTAPGLSPFCYIQGMNGIEIGDYTMIGPGVQILSANHSISNFLSHQEEQKIIIGKNCWIGANSIILPGVHLQEGTIVAAGSIVTKSYNEKNILLAGNPAIIKKNLKEVNTNRNSLKYEYKGFIRAD